jgi:hypothetical protein
VKNSCLMTDFFPDKFNKLLFHPYVSSVSRLSLIKKISFFFKKYPYGNGKRFLMRGGSKKIR